MRRLCKLTHVAVAGVAAALVVADGRSLAQEEPYSPPGRQPAPGAGDASKGYIPAPPGSETLSVALAEESLQLCESADFKGTEATINNIAGAANAGVLSDLPRGLNDSASSLRWNLPPGLLVVLYEDAAGKGEQLLLWGHGQMPDLHANDFDNKASRWAWYDVGGGAGGRSAGGMAIPHGAQAPTATVPADTLQMFIDQDFKNTMAQVSPVTGQKAGEINNLPSGIGDSLSAVRWNLPEGVVVMFYQDASGKKQQVGIWGHGEVADLDIWDINDKASRWSWAYIGSPARITPPKVTPPKVTPPKPPTPPQRRQPGG